MRKRTFVFIVSLALLSWAAVTYRLFLQRPQGKIEKRCNNNSEGGAAAPTPTPDAIS